MSDDDFIELRCMIAACRELHGMSNDEIEFELFKSGLEDRQDINDLMYRYN